VAKVAIVGSRQNLAEKAPCLYPLPDGRRCCECATCHPAEYGDRVAIVGSRQGADLEKVKTFVQNLHAKHPDTLLISGGADGVDKTAETTWLGLGGDLWSFRVKATENASYGLERWELGLLLSRIVPLPQEPTWADAKSALWYRNLLIAEACDKLVLFHAPNYWGGGGHCEEAARAAGKQTWVYQ